MQIPRNPLWGMNRENRVGCIKKTDEPFSSTINLDLLQAAEPIGTELDRLWNDERTKYNCFQYAVSGINRLPRESIPLIGGLDPRLGFDTGELQKTLFQMGLKWAHGIGQMKDHYLIAAVVDIGIESNSDYHFYRLDADGSWSHKFNNYRVSRLDARGNKILDPKSAVMDYRRTIINGFNSNKFYHDFAGFFYVPNEGLIK